MKNSRVLLEGESSRAVSAPQDHPVQNVKTTAVEKLQLLSFCLRGLWCPTAVRALQSPCHLCWGSTRPTGPEGAHPSRLRAFCPVPLLPGHFIPSWH